MLAPVAAQFATRDRIWRLPITAGARHLITAGRPAPTWRRGSGRPEKPNKSGLTKTIARRRSRSAPRAWPSGCGRRRAASTRLRRPSAPPACSRSAWPRNGSGCRRPSASGSWNGFESKESTTMIGAMAMSCDPLFVPHCTRCRRYFLCSFWRVNDTSF